ncbi:MAG TPA: hypothetical protein VFA20_29045 [Myxococcaceae bacterium]|nr:hypothetical protein [Myxococcaceae bacterium]
MRSATLAAAALMLACNQVDLCSWHTEPVLSDGAAARCLTSDDCPREASAVVCDSDADPDKDCVRCASGTCERVVAERCP